MAMEIDPLGLIEEAVGERGEGVRMVAVAQIRPNPAQPRQTFSEEGLQELAASIRQHGLLQPLVVQPAADGQGYVLLCGERRWRAAQMAGLEQVPVVVHAPVDEATARMLSLVENLQREDLNDIERAEAIVTLKQQLGVSWEELARRLGMSARRVMQLAALTRLAEPVKELIEQGKLTARHGQQLGRLRAADEQSRLARRAVRENWSAEQLREAVQERLEKQRRERRRARERELHLELAKYRVQDVAGIEPVLETAALLRQAMVEVDWKKVPARQRGRARGVLEAVLAELQRAIEELGG